MIWNCASLAMTRTMTLISQIGGATFFNVFFLLGCWEQFAGEAVERQGDPADRAARLVGARPAHPQGDAHDGDAARRRRGAPPLQLQHTRRRRARGPRRRRSVVSSLFFLVSFLFFSSSDAAVLPEQKKNTSKDDMFRELALWSN